MNEEKDKRVHDGDKGSRPEGNAEENIEGDGGAYYFLERYLVLQ